MNIAVQLSANRVYIQSVYNCDLLSHLTNEIRDPSLIQTSVRMSHQKPAYSFGSNNAPPPPQQRQQAPKPVPNRSNTTPAAAPVSNSNHEFLRLFQLAIQNRKISLENLISIVSKL